MSRLDISHVGLGIREYFETLKTEEGNFLDLLRNRFGVGFLRHRPAFDFYKEEENRKIHITIERGEREVKIDLDVTAQEDAFVIIDSVGVEKWDYFRFIPTRLVAKNYQPKFLKVDALDDASVPLDYEVEEFLLKVNNHEVTITKSA